MGGARRRRDEDSQGASGPLFDVFLALRSPGSSRSRLYRDVHDAMLRSPSRLGAAAHRAAGPPMRRQERHPEPARRGLLADDRSRAPRAPEVRAAMRPLIEVALSPLKADVAFTAVTRSSRSASRAWRRHRAAPRRGPGARGVRAEREHQGATQPAATPGREGGRTSYLGAAAIVLAAIGRDDARGRSSACSTSWTRPTPLPRRHRARAPQAAQAPETLKAFQACTTRRRPRSLIPPGPARASRSSRARATSSTEPRPLDREERARPQGRVRGRRRIREASLRPPSSS